MRSGLNVDFHIINRSFVCSPTSHLPTWIEKQPSKGRFETFAASAIRGPRKGILQHLISQHLISAVSSHSLKKIRLICEAAMTLEKPESAGIDMEEIDVLHKNVLGFLLTTHYKWGKSKYYCYMSWPFQDTQENYKKYIAVWRTPNTAVQYYPVLGYCYRASDVEQLEKERRRVEDAVDKLAAWESFFWITRKGMLTEASYTNLVSQFTAWALPKVQRIVHQVAKQVSPGLYYEVLQSMTQGGQDAAKPRLAREVTD